MLNDADVATVEHEYDAGPGGDDVVGLLNALAVLSIVVVHTVLRRPTPHQRFGLEAVCAAAAAVVVTTEHARNRLWEDFDVGAGRISVIPRGAATQPSDRGRTGRAICRRRVAAVDMGFLGLGTASSWPYDWTMRSPRVSSSTPCPAADR